MPIEFRCNQCNKLLRVDDSSAGKKARCPECATIQDVPQASAMSSAPTSDYPYYGQSTPAAPARPGAVPMSGPSPSPPAPGSAPRGKDALFPETMPPQYTPPQYTPSQYTPSQYTPSQSTAPQYTGAPNYTGSGSPFAPQSGPAVNPYSDYARPNPYAAPQYGYSALSPEQARSRVKPPAIALLIFSLLILAFAALFFVLTFVAMNDRDEEAAIGLAVIGVLVAASACIPAIGGLMMLSMRAWGLCMAVAVLSTFAGVMACLPLAPFGIWALVVLLDSNVKAAFR
jgi:phage FluMu protein Com